MFAAVCRKLWVFGIFMFRKFGYGANYGISQLTLAINTKNFLKIFKIKVQSIENFGINNHSVEDVNFFLVN